MKKAIASFGTGLVFALGLGLSGMTQPSKVLGFLDIAGRWDPSLLFVMGGAVLFGLLVFPRILSRERPLMGSTFHLPSQHRIDLPLMAGSVLFGIGWGLSGYCPGPALVSLVTGAPGALVFLVTMLSGMVLFEVLQRRGTVATTRATVATTD